MCIPPEPVLAVHVGGSGRRAANHVLAADGLSTSKTSNLLIWPQRMATLGVPNDRITSGSIWSGSLLIDNIGALASFLMGKQLIRCSFQRYSTHFIVSFHPWCVSFLRIAIFPQARREE
jgi:hypothetical protein